MLRYDFITTFALPHTCKNNDVEINGYKIYKGTDILINYVAIHHNQPNGNKFDISRWLDKNDNFNKKFETNSFLICGYSSRDCNHCIGKNVAKQELNAVFALPIRKYIIYI